ncbi:hypothetical protein HX747_14430 [Streptomyces sp. L06]|nr:hypothetical protein [Streptomyces sp. L06]
MTGAAPEEFGGERRGVRLSTPRLLLRPVETGDLDTFLRLWTDPVVRRHLGGPVPATTSTPTGARPWDARASSP